MGARKWEPHQLALIKPATYLWIGCGLVIASRPKDFQRNSVACNRMLDRAEGFEHPRLHAKCAPRGRLQIRLIASGFQLNVWKLPQLSIYEPFRSLAHKHARALLRNESNEASLRDTGTFASVRQFMHALFSMGATMLGHRANTALRILWQANERAKFHERLVQVGAHLEFKL